MKNIYPNCHYTFTKWCKTNKFENIYKKIGSPKPFDVTLRDGLQSLTKDEQNNFTNLNKLTLYYKNKLKYNPINMEIGSIVSNKVLPVFKDSNLVFNYVEINQNNMNQNNLNKDKLNNVNHFILIPNEKQFENIYEFMNLRNFSFITSVSESFQKKNTKMSLDKSYQEIYNMSQYIEYNYKNALIKLYISCINECPIEGKINNDTVVSKLIDYQQLKPDILCLSDTCGTLKAIELEYILLKLNKYSTTKNIGLHLHVKKGREDEVEKLIHTALDFNINSFDVSSLDSGGCSVTMESSKLAPNLSYDLYYKSLCNYMTKKST